MSSSELLRGIVTAPARGAVAAALCIGLLGGCVHHHHHEAPAPSVHARHGGPPPHAPAHGYRHKRNGDGVELVFDAGLGVYVVLGTRGTYWHGDRYLRWSGRRWSASHRLDGEWVVVASDTVPTMLVRRVAGNREKSKSHGKGAWPAKRAD